MNANARTQPAYDALVSTIPGLRKHPDGVVAKGAKKGSVEYSPQNFVGVRTCVPAEVREINGRMVVVRLG